MFLPFVVAQGKAINRASDVNKNLHKNVEVLDCKMMWKVTYWSELIQRRNNRTRYHPPTKLQEGNVFTGLSVILSIGGWWVSLVPCPFQGWVSLVSGHFHRGGMSGGRYQSPVHVNKEWVLHKCHRESIIKKCF